MSDQENPTEPRPSIAQTVSAEISRQEAERQQEVIDQSLEAESSFDPVRKTFSSGFARRVAARIKS